MMLAGAIFDLDGTLADTLPACYAAFRAACDKLGGPRYTDAEIRVLFGPSEEGMVQRAMPHCWQDALAVLLEEYRRHLALCPRVFPPVASALDQLRRRRVPLALVTGKGPQTTATSLSHFGLEDAFDHVVTGSPAGVVKAAAIARVVAAWGVAPGEVVYVGDAVADMQAAEEAGVLGVAAAWAPSAFEAELAATRPHALFTDVGAFESWLIAAFSPGVLSPARRRSGGSPPAR
jgi:phosphoglycolate phosphatase-like HAD superfamily hydrolase